ncbi:hypothetical protein EF913_12675 [Streptomyces sp. WAC04189]|nr:hypothetical protein DBP22_20075 [Streptomyces sp. CS207]QCB25804.1 hypothetical protein E5N77_31290 [Streptomyces sp. SS52]RIH59522.1 hypothetical protein D3C59_26250 [Streptomyces sp. SHP22-7]RSS02665.1 hypothetical protein EF913_12675 [Streptomyces sp. WAC04189]RSS18938.1 hypothetical protein EF915_00635 [Streptomyces sp. WAC08401]RSS24726.1 hypothetical protein EF916_26880 [Streptomyces sp. WAC08452]RSS67836.1 hypothetical protein EF907_10325 [Streptomyces sp. WAC06273]RSS76340.1 hypo
MTRPAPPSRHRPRQHLPTTLRRHAVVHVTERDFSHDPPRVSTWCTRGVTALVRQRYCCT